MDRLDPAYITHFLLTYRRFASPRSVLLAMQKRMRQLDNPSGDPMFACFAQMRYGSVFFLNYAMLTIHRICHLLEIWIRDYPYDFAVPGTAGALSALIKSIISKTYLLHYGSDFLPFLEILPSLVDHDAAWALKVDDIDGSDDTNSLFEEEEPHTPDVDSAIIASPISPIEKPVPPLPSMASRERKPSLPLPSIISSNLSAGQTETDTSEKQQIKDLVKLAQEVLLLDVDDIAQEITRVEVKLFLDIKVCFIFLLSPFAPIYVYSRDIGLTILSYQVRRMRGSPSRPSTQFPTTSRIGEQDCMPLVPMVLQIIEGLYLSFYATRQQGPASNRLKNSLRSLKDYGRSITIRLCERLLQALITQHSQVTRQWNNSRQSLQNKRNFSDHGMYSYSTFAHIVLIVLPYETRKAHAYLHCKHPCQST